MPDLAYQRILPTLHKLCDGLADLTDPWAITGSLGFALQGAEGPVHDIDLQTSQTGALEIGRRFSEFVVRPVVFSQADRIRSYYGALEVNGESVEIMGDLQKRMPDGSWEDPVDVSAVRRWVEVGGLRVPVMDLEYEYLAYRILGRIEKAQMLREWLDAHPPVAEH
ncbi:MAG TPA: hypothetical protein VGJ97_03410 [Anaerolineaceae bacterium]|jgi:hypothetical protein